MRAALLRRLGRSLPQPTAQALVEGVADRGLQPLLEVIGPRISADCTLDTRFASLDLTSAETIGFEELAPLFASTSLDHGVIAMTVRQAAYIFGTVRRMRARQVMEIGRWKGGSTVLLAAAMGAGGKLWSIDLSEKETRLRAGGRPFDDQIIDLLARLRLDAHLLVGDSRSIDVDTGELDLVLIDGDHSYAGASSDFNRFGRRVRLGGAVIFDDTFDEAFFRTHSDSVGRLVQEILNEGEFRLVGRIDRLAHLERTT